MMDFSYYKDGNINPELFVEVAQKCVGDFKYYEIPSNRPGGRPKSVNTTKHQVRRFYHELLSFCQKIELKAPEERAVEFERRKPFLRMMINKAFYAKERENVTPQFFDFIKTNINQVNKYEDLEIFRLFFEAVVAYCEELRR
jgi:CRISPR-associated protein Csm2